MLTLLFVNLLLVMSFLFLSWTYKKAAAASIVCKYILLLITVFLYTVMIYYLVAYNCLSVPSLFETSPQCAMISGLCVLGLGGTTVLIIIFARVLPSCQPKAQRGEILPMQEINQITADYSFSQNLPVLSETYIDPVTDDAPPSYFSVVKLGEAEYSKTNH